MSVLSDTAIKEEVNKRTGDPTKLVDILPFNDKLAADIGGPSKGLTSIGYDLTLNKEIKIYKIGFFNKLINKLLAFFNYRKPFTFIDIKNLNKSKDKLKTVIMDESGYVIYPGESFLGNSTEWLYLSRNISGDCLQKSTLARTFLDVTVTPLEPGWQGYLTLEIKNNNPYPIKIYPGIGICQLQFNTISGNVEVAYNDRDGKYMNQVCSPVVARGAIN